MARDSNVNLYVLMWSPRQQYVFVSVLFISINILHASSLFYLLTYLLTMFSLFFIFNMFYFNCCLNKIFVIVIVIVMTLTTALPRHTGNAKNM